MLPKIILEKGARGWLKVTSSRGYGEDRWGLKTPILDDVICKHSLTGKPQIPKRNNSAREQNFSVGFFASGRSTQGL